MNFTRTAPALYSTKGARWSTPDGRYVIEQIVGAPRPFHVSRIRKPIFSGETVTFVDSFSTLEAAKTSVRALYSPKALAERWGWTNAVGSDRKFVSVEEIKAARRAHWAGV